MRCANGLTEIAALKSVFKRTGSKRIVRMDEETLCFGLAVNSTSSRKLIDNHHGRLNEVGRAIDAFPPRLFRVATGSATSRRPVFDFPCHDA
jgi:hypothetical protein